MKLNLIQFSLFLILFTPNKLWAQTWKPLGPDENDNPSLTFSVFSKVASAPDGTPYVAISDNTLDEKITVKRFDGTRWVVVGQPGFTEGFSSDIGLYFAPDGTPYVCYVNGQNYPTVSVRKFVSGSWIELSSIAPGDGPTLAFTTDGTPYVAFTPFNGYALAVEKFTGGSWSAAGDENNISATAVNSSKLIIGSDDTPYIVFSASSDTNRISVKKLVSGQWQYVGNAGFSNQHMATVTMAIAADGTLYAAGQDTYNKSLAMVSVFKNGTWTDISNGGLSLGQASTMEITVGPDLVPWLIFSDGGNAGKATLLKYNGTAWINSGILSAGATGYTSIAVSNANVVYTCYTDATLNDKVMVKSLVNGQFSEVASGGISNDATPIVLLQTSASGTEFVAFNDAFYNNKLSVKQFTGNAWNYTGPPGISRGNAKSIDLTVAPDGTPYVIFADSTTSKGVVTKYTNGTWQQVGGVVTTGGGIGTPKIVVASNGTPFVAYQDYGYSGQITVQSYTGGQWNVVGVQTFSPGSASGIQLVIDPNNVPYVAYMDATSGNKVNVKKFDGTSWVSVGAANFSAGQGSNLSLTINPAGVPYIAYYDQSAGFITQYFNNGGWTNINQQSLSTGSVSNVKLVFDENGKLYLLYTQSVANVSSTLVKNLVQGTWTDVSTNAMVPLNNMGSTLSVTPSGNLLFAYLSPQLYVREQTSDNLAAAPIITTCTPNIGGTGTVVTITGYNFTTTSSVKFGQSNAASFTVVSPTTITATVGNGATGLVNVNNAYGAASFDNFTFTGTVPQISSFSPSTGPLNTIVTIKGRYFGTTPAANIVSFGAVHAQVISANDSTLQVEVPNGSTFEPISVTTGNLTAFAAAPFDVTFKATIPLGTGSFAAPQKYPAIQNPQGLIVRDIDNDGLPDIVTADYGSMFYHNRSANGIIMLDTTSNRDDSGYSLATNDFDGDGKPDLLLGADGANLVKNNSSPGSLAFLPEQSFLSTSSASAAQTADIDGDGRPDVIIYSNTAAYIAIIRTVGVDSNYVYGTNETDIQLGVTPLNFCVADLDGDGKPDLIVLEPNYTNFNGADYLVIYKNISTQNNIAFTKVAQYNTEISPGTPVIEDVDGDGKPDIMLPNEGSNTVTIYQNQSTSTIAFSNGTDITTGNKPLGACVADLDGDGKPDLAVTNYADNTVSVFRNTGGNGNLSFSAKTDFSTGAGPVSVAAGDIDGDGAPELIVADNQDNTLSILHNNVIAPAISQTNFTVAVTSATCDGANNGSISITAAQTLNYLATITGAGVNKSISFTSSATVDSLAAGTYNVCITIQNDAGFQQCYTLIVTQPKDLSVYLAVNPAQTDITLLLNGGNTYNINLNDKLYTTTDSTITLPLAVGDNTLSVSTDKACQGIFSKTINVSGVSIYPDPFQKTLMISIGNSEKTNTVIEIRGVTSGNSVYKQSFGTVSGLLQLDLSNLPNGVYALSISADNYHKTFKIIKQ